VPGTRARPGIRTQLLNNRRGVVGAVRLMKPSGPVSDGRRCCVDLIDRSFAGARVPNGGDSGRDNGGGFGLDVGEMWVVSSNLVPTGGAPEGGDWPVCFPRREDVGAPGRETARRTQHCGP